MFTAFDVFPFAQTFFAHVDAFGLIGLALGIAASLAPTRGLILLALAGSSLGFAVHFWLLDSSTGFAMCLIAIVQSLIAYRFGASQAGSVWLATVFAGTAALALALTALSWHGWASALAGSGAVLATLARLQTRTDLMRRYLAAVSLCWAGHDLMIGSICSLASEILTLSVLAVAVWRDAALSRPFARVTPGAPSALHPEPMPSNG